MFRLIFSFLALACFFGCEKEDKRELCPDLKAALLHMQVDLAQDEVDEWLADYAPMQDDLDIIGHAVNLEAFVEHLKNNCDLDASVVCYACIETLPVQSEVGIQFDSLGTIVPRVLDLLTPDDGPMTLREIHR